MKIKELAMIAAVNSRSRRYLDALLGEELLPGFVLVLTNPPGERSYEQTDHDSVEKFLAYLDEAGLDYSVVPTTLINDPATVNAVGERPERFFLYSGAGGQILREEILGLGKEFLHVHSGSLPEYRGSTTVYYQILNRVRCGATAILLRAELDAGPIIIKKEFDPPREGEDIDHEYDPRIRAEVLVEAVKVLRHNQEFQPDSGTESHHPYYIAHPLLRHIAKLSLS